MAARKSFGRPGTWASLAGAALVFVAFGCAQRDTVADAAWKHDEDHERFERMLAAQRARNAAPSEEREAPSFDEQLARGDGQRAGGDLAEALWSYLEAHRIDPASPAPQDRIAYLYLREDPTRAEGIFSTQVQEHPRSASSRVGLGLAQLAQGRLEAARESLETAIELDSDSGAAHSALGVVYDRLGRHAEAQAELSRALAIEPRSVTVLNNLGVSYLASGEPVRAEATLRSAIQHDTGAAALRNNLGLALGLQRRYDEALVEFRRAGSEQAAQNNLGFVHYLNGEPEAAIRCYERALLSDGPDKVTVLRNLNAARQLQQEPQSRLAPPATAPPASVGSGPEGDEAASE